MVHMFGYTKNPDVPLRIWGHPPHFANILQFFAQLSEPYHFDVQTYGLSICYLVFPMVFLKIFLFICPHFDKIVFQSVEPLTA